MKTIIIAPDSFKGTLDSEGVCRAAERGVKISAPDWQCRSVPIADGGEGTVSCFLRAAEGSCRVDATVTGPFYDRKVTASYARMGDTAVIEMAAAAGLPLAGAEKDPRRATTYGVGELIGHAVRHGATRIVLGLGGSCTNDCGVGMARALGTVFYDEAGEPFCPMGDSLTRIASYDTGATEALLRGVTVTAMCDITNPLYGPDGAACVFAPQKGAGPETVGLLDDNLQYLAKLVLGRSGIDLQSVPGTGAAGGMGAGVLAFLGGSLRPGIDQVLELVGFDRLLDQADLVITGEGRFDSQSLGGKAVSGVGKRAKEKGLPVIVIAGAIGEDLDPEAVREAGISALFSINPAPVDFETARHRTAENIEQTVRNIVSLLKTVES